MACLLLLTHPWGLPDIIQVVGVKFCLNIKSTFLSQPLFTITDIIELYRRCEYLSATGAAAKGGTSFVTMLVLPLAGR
jgi:hypothetical protein